MLMAVGTSQPSGMVTEGADDDVGVLEVALDADDEALMVELGEALRLLRLLLVATTAFEDVVVVALADELVAALDMVVALELEVVVFVLEVGVLLLDEVVAFAELVVLAAAPDVIVAPVAAIQPRS